MVGNQGGTPMRLSTKQAATWHASSNDVPGVYLRSLINADMHWTKEMAERTAWLLCALHSGHYDQHFEGRTVRIVSGKTVRLRKLAA